MKYRQLYRTKEVGGLAGGQYTWLELSDGTRRRASGNELMTPPPEARVFRGTDLTSQTVRVAGTTVYPVDVEGQTFMPSSTRGWSTSPEGMAKLKAARRPLRQGSTLSFIRYLDDFSLFPANNLWEDTVVSGFGDPRTYVVQTNTKVVERCLLMCTDPGDLVLDPTCGSGTTAYVAEQWGRRWITIDTSRVALALARQRLMGARFPYYIKADSPEGRAKEQEITGKPLPRAQTSGDIKQGFVYERVQHITLKSIANNPDIVEGMSRAEIDAAIKRHAEFEVLYDRPYEDRNKVRVAGRFTVESLSPHRSLAFDQRDATAHRESISEQVAAEDAAGPNFEQSILDNLTKAGIQNGKRNERITFATLDTYPGLYLQAVGERSGGNEDAVAPSRVGIAIGPQYGTVSPAFIKAAAREAIAAGDVDSWRSSASRSTHRPPR